MKSFLRSLLAISATVIGYAILAVYVPAVRIAPICAPAEAFLINQGIIKPKDADWGYLKLRSGKDGLNALQALKQSGSSDDIRITADAVLDDYKGASDRCGDAPCSKESDFRTFKPRLRALGIKTDLHTGQTLPHAFFVDSANDWWFDSCTHPSPEDRRIRDCILRMQDFDGDGEGEIYLEIAWKIPDLSEDDTRVIYVYSLGAEGWAPLSKVVFSNSDGSVYPARPFTLEAAAGDLLIDHAPYSLARFPEYDLNTAMTPGRAAPQAARLKAIAAFADKIAVVLPNGGHLPAGFVQALKADKVVFEPLSQNAPAANRRHAPVSLYPTVPECTEAQSCRAIVADIDHDGRDDVVLIAPGDLPAPEAIWVKDDGDTWRVMSHVRLCGTTLGTLSGAEIYVMPGRWRVIRLGKALYPLARNPWCGGEMSLP